MTQEKPVQQSAVAVQTAPEGWHCVGVWQVPLLLQVPEQHSAALWQGELFDLQRLASVPASVGIRQKVPNSSPMHSPLQHGAPPPPVEQAEPSGTHELWLQRRIPWLSGTHGAPLQH